MARPRSPVPKGLLNLSLPSDLLGWLGLQLFSELEGRVPVGAYQEFFSRKIREEMEWKRLDLTPYGFAAGAYVAGPAIFITELELKLKGES